MTHLFAAAVYLYRGADNPLTKYHLEEGRRLIAITPNIEKVWPTAPALRMFDEEKDRLFGSGTHQETRTLEGWSPLVVGGGAAGTTGAVEDGIAGKIKMDILICHCRENLDWLKGPDFRVRSSEKVEITLLIYDKCRIHFLGWRNLLAVVG